MKKTNRFIFGLIIIFCQQAFAGELINLNQNWTFRKANTGTWLPANVPGSVHTDLLANKQIKDPYQKDNAAELSWIDSADWEYSTTFILSEEQVKNQGGEIDFNGLDTYASVYLNDSLILNADNMFRTWKVNCIHLLKPGKNSLRILFESALKKGAEQASKIQYTLPGGDRVFTRKAAYQYGWDFAPRFITCGIWKSIELRLWNNFTFRDIRIKVKELTEKRAILHMEVDVLANEGSDFNLKMINKATGQRLGKTDSLHKGMNTVEYDYQIYGPKKWWCNGYGEPFLYTFYFEGSDFKGNVDRKEFSYGLRTLELMQDKDSTGKGFYFRLNGVPIFAKGANVVPLDMFNPEGDNSVVDSLVSDAARCNMNMLRVWGGGVYLSDEFYSQCDRKGILVWQDFMFACSMLPGDPEFVSNVKEEVQDNVRRLRHHPCIALWCGNNECEEGWANWGWQKEFKYTASDSAKIWNDYKNIFYTVIPDILKQEDPARAYWPSSPSLGWGHPESLQSGDSHYWGVWWGKEPFSNYENKVGRFMSEYGFQGMPANSTLQLFGAGDKWKIDDAILKAHQKHPTGFETIKEYMKRDFPEPWSSDRFLYYSQLLQADGMQTAIEAHRRSSPRCMGTLYWQLNDPWPGISWSSRDYFGKWKASQYMVQDRYKMVIVSPVIERDKLNTYIISDSTNDLESVLLLRLFSFDGKEKWFHKEPVNLKPGTSTLAYSVDTIITKQKIDPAKGYLLASVVSKGILLDQRIFYFRKPNELILPKAKPEYSVDSTEGYLIMKSKVLIKNLYLKANGNDQFGMNFFDVIPNLEYRIPLPAGVSGNDVKIEFESLNDKK
ncbi:MAG: glycoside hydrolase family 2 protein [Bacteroidetes bacterium]|nr:glycoside hydrolase family 2 protein [Bacteroidota bacterium]